ncbi:hypothetical protein [Miltoncostaea oceani]|uniref:hypothetical protein n=1 Tax=Miltoncostaea oceani TaxID=2843216 RepID=UPI001C3C95D3|nr:hypothetical protein [Miltoncostaea oceani]
MRERVRRRRVTGVAIAAALAAAPAGAGAAPVALPPVDVSPAGSSATAPRAGMDASGALVVVWQAPRAGGPAVWASTRPPAGAPGAPVAISAAGGGSAPALAVAPSGEAVAAWWRAGDAGTVVQAARRAPGGAFGAPVDLSAPGAFAPQVALAADGGAVVAWLRFDGAGTVVEAAVRPPGGAFGPPIPLSSPGRDAFAPQVAVAPGGRVAVAWNRGRPPVVEAALGTLTDGFAAARPLSEAGEDAYDPQIALTPGGGALVAWTRSDGASARTQLAVLPADPGAAPGAPVSVSAPGADATQPQVAVDAAGAAVLTWRRGAGGAERVQALTRSPAGVLSAPVDVSPAGAGAADPRLALDAAGRAVIAWRRTDGSDPRVQIATRDPGGAFAEPVSVSARGAVVADPRVALDGGGNGVVTWRRATGDDDIVQIAGLDDAPPVLLDVEVPASAVAGDPVRLGVRARDVWSPLAPGPTWSFGPGAGALGASIEHTFPVRGTYLVRIAQADAIGRVAVAERTIDVTPPAPVSALRAPAGTPPRAATSLRRPVALRIGWGWQRRADRVWLRVTGTAGRALAGRRVIVERRVGGGTRVLCRVPVTRSGRVAGRCRVDALMRHGTIALRVRARVTATRTTRARALPYVTRTLVPAPRKPPAATP